MQSIRSFLLRMGGLGVSSSKATGGILIRKKIGFVLSLFCGGFFLLVTSELAAAPVAITASGSYTQNFDSLPTSGTSNVWSNDGTLAGWWAEQASGGAIAIIRAGDGGSNSGALYSFGTGTSTERALGSTSSGTPGTITFGVQLQNSTTSGQNLTLGDLQFTGEQWRNGGNTSSQQLTLWYRVSATPLTSLTPADDTGWTQLSALTFTSLVNTSTSAPLDGNSSANRTVLSASLSSISLPRGQYLFLRWKDINDIGNDHGFGIDDLSLSWTVEGGSTAVPVITSALTGTAEAGVSGFSYQITAENSPTSYAATGLPGGLSVNPVSALISGTPDKNAPGTYLIQISATNPNGTATETLVLTLNPNAGAPVLSAATVFAALGQPLNYTIPVTGAATSFTATGLPGWASLNTSTGVITGTPTLAATASVTLRAANSAGTSLPQTLTLNSGAAPAISQLSASLYAGVSGSLRILASGSPTSYTASLPSGLSLDAATGTISGTVAAAGTNSFSVSAVNAYGTANGTLDLFVWSSAQQAALPLNVVVNECVNANPAAGNIDQVELLVVGTGAAGSTADLRGMILKDFSSSLVDDTGGKFEFSQNSLWSAVKAGTLIVLSVGTTQTEDTDPADFVLRLNLGNNTYFTNRGGTFDVGGTDMVMIKAAGSGIQGVAGGIHALATASGTPTQFSAFTGKKLKATTTAEVGQAVAANNATSAIGDYGTGTATGGLTSFTLGAANNSANGVYLNQLRESPAVPVITSALTGNGQVGVPFSYTITASGLPTSFDATPLPAGLSRSGAVISGTPTAAGTNSVTLTAGNSLGSDTETLVLTIALASSGNSQTIDFPAIPGTPTYGDSAIPLQATASSGLPVTYSSSNTNVAAVSGSTLTITGAGAVTITANQSGNGVFLAAPPVSRNLTVAPKALTVSGLSGVGKTYDGSPTVSLTGTAVLNGIINGDEVTVSGGIGNCADASAGSNRPITVSGLVLAGADAAHYTVTSPTGLTVSIARRNLTVQANAAGKLAGASDPTLTYSVSGLVESAGLSGAPTRVSGEAAGSYAIQQGTLTASANYTLSFLSAPFTITTVYAVPANYYTNTSGKIGTDLKAALNSAIKAGYRSIPYGSGTGETVPALRYLYADPSNANNIILIYGGESFSSSAYGTGSNTWNIEHCWPQSYGTGSGFARSDLFHLRPCKANVNSDRSNTLYGNVANNTGAKTAPTCRELEGVMWEPPDSEKGQIARGMLYLAVRYEGSGDGGTANLELADTDNSSANLFARLTDLLEWNRNFPPDEKERWVNQEIYTKYQFNRNPFIDNPDYAEMVFRGIPAVSVRLTQNAAETGPSVGKVLLERAGPTTSSLTVQYVWGGSATPGTDTTTLATSATFPIGQSTVELVVTPVTDSVLEATEVLTLTLASSANYVSSQNSATMQIADAPVASGKTEQTLNFPAFTATPVYGDAPLNLAATASSGLPVSYASANPNVATVSGNVLMITGAGTVTITASQAGNTTFHPAVSVERVLTVEPKPVTIAGATASSKAYDRTVGATVNGNPTLAGVLAGDSVSLGSAAAVFGSKEVGTNKVVTTGYTLSGPDADHYRVVQPSGLTASITPAGLTVTGVTVANKAYDGTTVATLSGGTLVGVLGDEEATDDVSLAANPTGTFASKEVGTWSVTANFALTEVDAGNYTLIQPTGLSGTISAGSTLAGWGSSYGLTGTNAAAGADLDGDGFVNLAEYALGGNPANAAGGLGPTVSTTNTHGTNWLRFAYRARTNDAALVIQPVFKASLTETNWSTNGVVQKVSGQPAGDGVHEDQVWQTPLGAEARRFLKLNISR